MFRRATRLCLFTLALAAPATAADYRPVTDAVLLNPDPADWLMISRTFDQQRYSPLDQINKANVGDLRMAWSRGLTQGSQESTPIVHDGVMYVLAPGAIVQALDAASGDIVWEYLREYPKDLAQKNRPPAQARGKNLAIYEDMIYFAAPDGFLVALDAMTGKVRWETRAHDYTDGTEHASGLLVADGKLVSNRTCRTTRDGCFIAAHDARTGKELWKFFTTAAPGEPGGDTWGGLATERRLASSWGLPGSYDPVRKIVYWAIANPTPYTRLKRHGRADAVSDFAPSELYSNSTVALDVTTGRLAWHYQHLPADDWDSDHIHERTLARVKVAPDARFAKWISPAIAPGQERDIVFAVGEGGTMFALDRDSGGFLWAAPFPFDTPGYMMSDIDVKTGQVRINREFVFQKDGDRRLLCSYNSRSWWATAYDPRRAALYVPFQDACLDMTANNRAATGAGPRFGVQRPGITEDKFAGIMKINLSTGETTRIHAQPWPGNGSALVTGGDLLFWGDMNRRLRAFDPDSGKVLWEATVGGMIMASTITYAVRGRQYIAVLTGEGQPGTANVIANIPKLKANVVRGHNAVYVFALPEKR